jgi:tRNA-dihydrouridine synthase B
VQIAGYDPQMMAEAALFNVQLGAEIIDINMGCPAKKVCKRAAGSALLQNPELVERILTAVVSAVDVPVTLKIRTGWDRQNRNAETIARIAEDSGVAALAVHGRTKACRFVGEVEYDTIANVVDAVSIPVLANGDITDPQRAVSVLKHTGAAAVMIGRAAQGNPWIFNQINHFLKYDQPLSPPSMEECSQVMSEHLLALHEFYGETGGVRISRKHIGWYINPLPGGKEFTRVFNTLETTEQQRHFLQSFFLDLTCEEQVA